MVDVRTSLDALIGDDGTSGEDAQTVLDFAGEIVDWHDRMGLGDEARLGDHSGADQLQDLYEILCRYGLKVI